MTKTYTVSASNAHQRSSANAEGHCVMETGKTTDANMDTAERQELIASVVREWVVPLLVRKFLTGRASPSPGAKGEVDAIHT